MGAAKIRKKNGTYPTKEQIAAIERERLRQDINKPFVLTATDLKLPDVPHHARESVRQFLAPFLPSIPVKNCDCWGIAQRLMALANCPRVGYVEGVWMRKGHKDEHRLRQCDCDLETGMFAAPHAWNTLDGYLVDLSVENKFRLWTPEDADWDPLDNWWHEPLKAYTLADIRKYTSEQYELDGLSITVTICAEGYGEDYGLNFTCDDLKLLMAASADFEDYLFLPASDRLQARYEQSVREAAA